ncbi:hypothetical protein RclHR1_06920003 [Rhizophagus clarus]|uniref:Uncharacterized protein n=1 Tax=Rhizophagus clarus TaxID=94130 RepID=A0A2Z6RUZ6_9GLOM|nr:hypothetical protein RclHR1_06920003 [Rhizophagus clarus]GES82073.1 hypothetical protein RCL_jg10587.t1 [Rhizophagus clarus]
MLDIIDEELEAFDITRKEWEESVKRDYEDDKERRRFDETADFNRVNASCSSRLSKEERKEEIANEFNKRENFSLYRSKFITKSVNNDNSLDSLEKHGFIVSEFFLGPC